MKINDLCESIFRYVCILSDKSQLMKGNYIIVRKDIEKLLDDLKKNVSSDSYELWKKYELIILPLLCFIDYMVIKKDIDGISEKWDKQRLAFKEGCYTGDETFFSSLDSALLNRESFRDDILEFYFTCLNLGFRGMYEDDSDKISGYLWEINKLLGVKPVRREGELFIKPVSVMKSVKLKLGFTWRTFLLLLTVLFLLFTALSFTLYYDAADQFYQTVGKIEHYLDMRSIEEKVYELNIPKVDANNRTQISSEVSSQFDEKQ